MGREVKHGLSGCGRAAIRSQEGFSRSSRVRATCESITGEDMKNLPWLEPQLVAEVQFTDSLWFAPSCLLGGMRNNKEPNKVTREQI
jgi:hypothetical protein